MPESARAAKRARLRDLIRQTDLCVLATVGLDEDGRPRPHCSLMACLSGDDPDRELFFLTLRDTRKFENLIRHPHVSLLLDSRVDDAGERRDQARALTIAAEADLVTDPAAARAWKERLVEKHPQLAALAARKNCAVVRAIFREFTYLEGAEDVFREKV